MGLAVVRSTHSAQPASTVRVGPQYTADGELIRPSDHRTWVFVGASIGMGYSKNVYKEGPGRFHNIYIDTVAFRRYDRTGTFPDKTMLLMDVFESVSKASINRHGHFEGKRVAIEMAVKDIDRFKTGWAYFDFKGDEKGIKTTARAFPKSRCYDCHLEHGAVDNVFVQFYPILRPAEKPTQP